MYCPRRRVAAYHALAKLLALLLLPTFWLTLRCGGLFQTAALAGYLALASPGIVYPSLAFALIALLFPTFVLHVLGLFGFDLGVAYLAAMTCISIFLVSRNGLLDAHIQSCCPPRLKRALLKTTSLVAAASFVGAFFRDMPSSNTLFWACLYALCAWSLRALLPVPPTLAKRWLTRLATLIVTFVALLAALGIIEGGARLLLPPVSTMKDVYQADPKYLFLLQPGSKVTARVPLANGKTKSFPVRISSQGIRNKPVPPKQPGEFRIAMLGDSFTMGHAVAVENGIPALLGADFRTLMPGANIRVINCGIGGGGPLQELGMLRERVFPLKPDLVILQAFPSNDFDNALEPVAKYMRAYDENWQQIVETYRYWNLARYRVERWLFVHSRAYSALRQATQTEWILYFCKACRLIPPASVPEPPLNEKRPFWIEVNLAEWYPELDEGFRLFQSYVLRCGTNAESAESTSRDTRYRSGAMSRMMFGRS